MSCVGPVGCPSKFDQVSISGPDFPSSAYRTDTRDKIFVYEPRKQCIVPKILVSFESLLAVEQDVCVRTANAADSA